VLESRASRTATARRISSSCSSGRHCMALYGKRPPHLSSGAPTCMRRSASPKLGLNQLTRYGPLWYSALRLYELRLQGLLRATRASR
jgi:hypothetical protein